MDEARYADAGVDIDAGNRLVDLIKPMVRATARPGADAEIGGFGGLFDLKAAGFKDPILVAATDGVGTKVKIAIETGRHDTIGIDLVAMSVNDLVVQGAEPLFFLDYFACGKLDPGAARRSLPASPRPAARCGCALIGGETAEMPGLYKAGDYDLAGFAVGAVGRGRSPCRAPISRRAMSCSALPRRACIRTAFRWCARSLRDCRPRLGGAGAVRAVVTLGEALLTPTRLYVRSCLPRSARPAVKALAHITGGGFIDNIPRVLPQGSVGVGSISTACRCCRCSNGSPQRARSPSSKCCAPSIAASA